HDPLVGGIEEVDHPRGLDRNLQDRVGRADGERLREVAGIAHGPENLSVAWPDQSGEAGGGSVNTNQAMFTPHTISRPTRIDSNSRGGMPKCPDSVGKRASTRISEYRTTAATRSALPGPVLMPPWA